MFYATLLWHGGAFIAMVWLCTAAVKAKSQLFIAWKVLLPLALNAADGHRWRLLRALRHFEKVLAQGGNRIVLVCDPHLPTNQWAPAIGALWQACQGYWTAQNTGLQEKNLGGTSWFEWQEKGGQWCWTEISRH